MILVLIILCITALLSATLWLISQNPRHKIQAFLVTQIVIGIVLILFTDIQLAVCYLISSVIFAIVILFCTFDIAPKTIMPLLKSQSVFRGSALLLITISIIVISIKLIRKLRENGVPELTKYPQFPESYWIFVMLLAVLFIILSIIFKEAGAQND